MLSPKVLAPCPGIVIPRQPAATIGYIELTDAQKKVAGDGQRMATSKDWGGAITGHQFLKDS